MSIVSNFTHKLLILTVVLVLLPVETVAFGAGDIPDFAYLNDKAFRHGDIENVLEELVKTVGGVALGGGIMNIASSVLHQVTGGSKFSKGDIKKVYFGNWLRDYSQAMDIAGLGKLTADTLVLVVAVLGFMTFGFSTEEFEVTADRLGVYLPVEHIDNPKGYAEKEGDARRFHPKLRPPVQARELEIDERTGMKKYIATENQGWDTSTAFIRRTFRSCIERGRRAQGNEGPDLWEAYRLLGTGLHTMEDLLAHSNWCEIALRKMGYKEVFCHVGDNVVINTPNGRAPPLVTGTFGSADFLHSLIGEAGDKISQASVTDLSTKLNNAQGGQKSPDLSILKGIFGKFGGGDSQKLDQGNQMQQQAQGYQFNPDNIAPPEVKERLLQALKWHDDVMRDIHKKIEMVPGLSDLLEEFSNALNEYIYTVIAPYVVPMLTAATGALDEGSKIVIDNDDQFEVFNNPNAHDPSHSLLSKDHFGLILNEPAGKIAKVIVQNTVNLIVRAWSENSNPDDVINRILEAFHHPYYANGRSEIQKRMFDEMQKWIGGLGGESREVIQSLTKDAVRNHKNKRKGLDDTPEPGYSGAGQSGYNKPSFNTKVPGSVASGYGTKSDNQGYQSQYAGHAGYGRTDSGGQGSQRHDADQRYGDKQSYGGGHETVQASGDYGRKRNDETGYGYGSQRRDDTPSYNSGNTGYSGQRRDETSSYGGGYGGQRRVEDAYGGSNTNLGGQRRDGNNTGYGSQRPDDTPLYGGSQQDQSSYGGGNSNRYPATTGTDNYGGNRRRNDDDSRGPGYGGRTEQQSGSGGNSDYGQTQRPFGSGYAPSYGQPESRPNPSQGKYGRQEGDHRGGAGYGQKCGHNDDDSDDDKKKKNRHSDRDSDDGKHGGHRNRSHDRDDDRKQGHAQSSYGQTSSSYAPSYSGNNDTYGAERLNIRGEREDYDSEKKHHKHQGGYGY